MSSAAFSAANRALRAKRRIFSRELTAALDDAKFDSGLSLETFKEKENYFERTWDEIVTSTEDCINLIDDGEDQKDEQIEGSYLGFKGKERFLNLEGVIEKQLNMVDIKNVESVDGDTLQDEHWSAVGESSGGEPALSFIGKVGNVNNNEVVDPSQADEYYDESSSEISEQKKGEG